MSLPSTHSGRYTLGHNCFPGGGGAGLGVWEVGMDERAAVRPCTLDAKIPVLCLRGRDDEAVIGAGLFGRVGAR